VSKYGVHPSLNINYFAELPFQVGRIIGYSRINGRKVKYIIGKGKNVKRKRNKIYTYDVFLALRRI